MMSQPTSNKLGVDARSSTDRIIQELPSSRHFSRISPHLVAHIGDCSYPVIDLSLGGLALAMPSRDLPSNPPYYCEIFKPDDLSQRLAAFWIDPVSVGEHSDRIGFRIAEIDGKAQFDLRLLIKSHLDVAARPDPTDALGDVLVVRQYQAAVPSARSCSAPPVTRRWAGYAVWLALAMVLLTAVGLSAFDAIFGVRSISAAVAAPAVVLHAPQSGIVHANGLSVGDAVAREQLVSTIRDPKLETELALARAQVESGGKWLSSKRDLQLARVRLAALELERARSDVHSPCDCIVFDINRAYGGEWSQAGDRLMTLVPRNSDDVLIYALVPADEVRHLGAGQKVAISFPLTGETVDGAIEDILMRDGTAQWAGLPSWYGRTPGNVVVMVRPSQALSPKAVGQPAEISTTYITLSQVVTALARYAGNAENPAGADSSE